MGHPSNSLARVIFPSISDDDANSLREAHAQILMCRDALISACHQYNRFSLSGPINIERLQDGMGDEIPSPDFLDEMISETRRGYR